MSDTIIVYENGKAVGGEGHPTNANEITFDNTGTDIVANKTGLAIKEVNAKFDRGSVSVTADGSKTYGALFNELYALINITKISENSKLVLSVGGSDYYFILSSVTPYTLTFIRTTMDTNYESQAYILNASASKYASYNGTTVSNQTTTVPSSGRIFKIVY